MLDVLKGRDAGIDDRPVYHRVPPHHHPQTVRRVTVLRLVLRRVSMSRMARRLGIEKGGKTTDMGEIENVDGILRVLELQLSLDWS